MNGRIYDPRLGRFLQADPMVQAPKNSQNLNRYSYVLNNPLSYTDPSGYFFKRLFNKWIRPLAAIAMTIWQPWGSGLWASALTGSVAGWISTGNLKGALVGAFSGAVFHGIGKYFKGVADANPKVLRFVGDTGLTSSQFAAKIGAHSLAGGVMSELNGGKFGHGFFTAGATQALAPQINGIDGDNLGVSTKRVIAAAAVGGTVSELSGGKFANGAVTGAFSRALNDEQHRLRNPSSRSQATRKLAKIASSRLQEIANDNYQKNIDRGCDCFDGSNIPPIYSAPLDQTIADQYTRLIANSFMLVAVPVSAELAFAAAMSTNGGRAIWVSAELFSEGHSILQGARIVKTVENVQPAAGYILNAVSSSQRMMYFHQTMHTPARIHIP